jgi:hypothetical protein
MTEQVNQREKKKGFFGKLFKKIDKKLEEKAKQTPCCGGHEDKKGSSCC